MQTSIDDPLWAQILFWGRVTAIVLWSAYIARWIFRWRKTRQLQRYDKVLLVVGSLIIAVELANIVSRWQ